MPRAHTCRPACRLALPRLLGGGYRERADICPKKGGRIPQVLVADSRYMPEGDEAQFRFNLPPRCWPRPNFRIIFSPANSPSNVRTKALLGPRCDLCCCAAVDLMSCVLRPHSPRQHARSLARNSWQQPCITPPCKHADERAAPRFSSALTAGSSASF